MSSEIELLAVAKRQVVGRLAGHSLIATVGNVLARLGGLALAIAVAAVFGATDETDAFYLTLAVTLYIFGIIVIALEGAFIPEIADRIETGREAVEEFLGAAAKYWILAASSVAIPAALFGSLIGPQVPGTAGLCILYASLLIPALVPMGVAAVWNAFLYAQKRFFLTAVSNACRPAGAVAALFLFGKQLGLWSAAAGYLAGSLIQAALVYSIVRRQGVRILIGGKLAAIWGSLKFGWPIVAGAVLINLNPVVDRVVAAVVLPGSSVTLYENAFKFFGAFTSVLYSSAGVVLISYWSEMSAKSAVGELIWSLKIVGIISVAFLLPVTAVAVMVAGPLVEFGLGHGAYTGENVAATASLLKIFLFGLWPFFAAGIGTRFLYSVGNSRIALSTSAIAMGLNLTLDAVLVKGMGLAGVALATTVTYAVVAGYVVYVIGEYSVALRREAVSG